VGVAFQWNSLLTVDVFIITVGIIIIIIIIIIIYLPGNKYNKRSTQSYLTGVIRLKYSTNSRR